MKKFLFLLACIFPLLTLFGQKDKDFKPSQSSGSSAKLKPMLYLQMPSGDGTNGASVAWHPALEQYYAAFAGNSDYPLAVFNASGKILSDKDVTTMADVRGLWFNPKKSAIQGNGYGEQGWFSYKLDTDGIPTQAVILFDGEGHQPEGNSVGTFDASKNQIFFLTYSDENKPVLQCYSIQSGDEASSKQLQFPKSEGNSAEEDATMRYQYHPTAVYTGVLGQEIALLNFATGRIELFNIATGKYVKFLKVPDDIPVPEIFNFAYANGYYWFFDKDNRKWIGCK